MNPSLEPAASAIFLMRAEMLAEEVAELRAKLAAMGGAGCPECAQLRAMNTRLNDDLEGLYDRIAGIDKQRDQYVEELEQSRDEWKQKYFDLQESIASKLDEQDSDDLSRYLEWKLEDKTKLERLRLLEGENAMLRRAKGSGVGRGRLPTWTPVHAAQVREAHAAGHSLRQIARDVGVTVAQVRTILARPAARPHPETERAELLVRRVQEIDHLIRGAQVAIAQESRRSVALTKAAKRRSK